MAEELSPQCSRKGCRAPGAWSLLWNNPKLHPPERRKVWLACEEHKGSLDRLRIAYLGGGLDVPETEQEGETSA